MMKTFQRDCTELCRSTQHGDSITAAITKREVSDFELCSYLNYICSNCEIVRDSNRRTALHVAVSCGRLDLVRWLLKTKNANTGIKDYESGYTPLHRALFYGKINVAIELIKTGACLTSSDFDYLTPIDHVTIDGIIPTADCGTVYHWGMNINNILGSFNTRVAPECLDIFHKRHTNVKVKQVCLDKFHSVIVTTEGEVFVCGHGLGGRLGLGTENTVVEPRKIAFHSSEKIHITLASISRDHCLFLTKDNFIYSCGLNKHRVLGIQPPPEKSLNPQRIKIQTSIVGVRAARYHSIAWDGSRLYIWGLNAGQLGHEFDSQNVYQCKPKLFNIVNTKDFSIRNVASSDGATAILTEKGDIYVLHEYQCRKIASKMLDARDIVITGGKLNRNLEEKLELDPSKELKLVVQTNVGNLHIWQESDPYLCRCIFSIPRSLNVKNVTINSNEILFTTKYGEAYKALIKPRKKKTLVEKKNVFNSFLNKDECVMLKLTKISKIHRAVFITSDPKGEDYCVIQQDPHLENITSEMKFEMNLEKELRILLNESNADDNIHDVQIRVGGKMYPLHKYILVYRCGETFKNLCEADDIINLKDFEKDLFEEMLNFIYTGTCDLLQVGKCPEKFLNSLSTQTENSQDKNMKNPIRKLQEMSKKIGCTQLYECLHSYGMQEDMIFMKSSNKKNTELKVTYKVNSYPEYHDVILKCQDKKELKAHRCMLAARMEYFNSLFSTRWNGGNVINMPHLSKIVEALLEFLYTDKLDFLSDKDWDFLLKLIILSDEYLMLELKTKCSVLLLTPKFLDLKNAVELLEFSHYYKAVILKEGVMKYIVNNMAFYLETQMLNDLNDDILTDLTQCYMKERNQSCRIITPYSTAVSDEIVIGIHENFPVDNEVLEVKKTTVKYPKRRIRMRNNSEKNIEKSPDVVIQFSETSQDPQSIEKIDETLNSSIDSNAFRRLEAISKAVKKLESEDSTPDFINLNASFNTSYSSVEDFPLLSSPTEKNGSYLDKKLWKNSGDNKQRIVRLSQKERKRLSSESKEIVPSQVVPGPSKNPWKTIVPEITEVTVADPNSVGFGQILSNERKQKENLKKLTNKLLKHTQLEDKAISELGKFYNIDCVEDEVIIVQRVGNECIASPIWIQP